MQSALQQAAEHRVALRHGEAAAIYAEIERRNPEALDATYFLALIDLARNRPSDALPRLERLSRRLPDEVRVWNALAYSRQELGQWREALQAMDRVDRIRPDEPNPHRPMVLEVLGRLDDAIAAYRRLAARPDSRLSALAGLAHLQPTAITEAEAAEIGRAAAARKASPQVNADLYFALGEIEERRGRYGAAFAAFVVGNSLKRRMLTGELPQPEPPPIGPHVRALHPDAAAEEHRAAIAFRKAVFTRDFIGEYEGQGHHVATPIFVVGMPRSGSTLIEQILSSHRRVQGLGETPSLADSARGRYPDDLFAPTPPGHFRNLAEAYLQAMHAVGWVSTPRFVDKMLRNYIDIGLIHLMFPKAVILHSVRDPVETCLACYRKLFLTSHETTYDLGDVGRDYVRYRAMMDHWTSVLPGRVIDVAHEGLVADPERKIRWLVTEACGLEWDEACLRFYETRRPVRTASVAQVRQPIFTTSLQRWRRYENHLGPLFQALGPYAPTDRILTSTG